jgi:hypothetical protein
MVYLRAILLAVLSDILCMFSPETDFDGLMWILPCITKESKYIIGNNLWSINFRVKYLV